MAGTTKQNEILGKQNKDLKNSKKELMAAKESDKQNEALEKQNKELAKDKLLAKVREMSAALKSITEEKEDHDISEILLRARL